MRNVRFIPYIIVLILSLPFAAPAREPAVASNADETPSKHPENGDAIDPGSGDQSPADGESRLESVHAQMVLKVINPDEARGTIKKVAQEMGGYATHLNDNAITLKIAQGKLADAINEFSKQGIVVTKTIKRKDLTLEIAQLEGKLMSQLEILKKLRGFFDDSDFAATLDIERSMSSLVNEIESVKGRLRYLKEQSKWAVIEVNFRFRERERVMYVASPFEWLNGANLDAFLEEF